MLDRARNDNEPQARHTWGSMLLSWTNGVSVRESQYGSNLPDVNPRVGIERDGVYFIIGRHFLNHQPLARVRWGTVRGFSSSFPPGAKRATVADGGTRTVAVPSPDSGLTIKR